MLNRSLDTKKDERKNKQMGQRRNQRLDRNRTVDELHRDQNTAA